MSQRIEPKARKDSLSRYTETDTKPRTDLRIEEEKNSYRVKDVRTETVTRRATRKEALRRLDDLLEQYEDGEPVTAQIKGIVETTLTPDYAQEVESLVRDCVSSEDKSVYIYTPGEGVEEVEGHEGLRERKTVAGFAVAGTFTLDEFEDKTPVAADRLLDKTPLDKADFPVSLFKITAAHPEYQGRGIGTEMVAHAGAELADNPPIVAMLWESGNDANVSIADNHGAQRLAEFDVTPSEWRCSECGFGERCGCGSAFYGYGL